MSDFSRTRALFHLPEGVIYLDGNSLGPLPHGALERLNATARDEWGEMLITGWNRAGWMSMPRRIGDRIGALIGAPEKSVSVGDTLSIKMYQALASALDLNPGRRIVLSDTGNFPTDLYMAQGLIRTIGAGHELLTVAPEDVMDRISDQVAVVMLTEVDYRTGRRHDMKEIIRLAHENGALVIWDLAHSAGAIEVDLAGLDVDFAAGCTYKYLNSGPGGPAFIYVAPRLQGKAIPALSGWLGHARPFDFEQQYNPADGVERMRVGTPAILQMAALDAALDVWDGVDMAEIERQSAKLTSLFIEEVEKGCPELELVTPREPKHRGSQVSFRFENGYAAIQALIARGVIGDFRAPDIMRFGFAPLYVTESDTRQAAAHLVEIIREQLWDREEFKTRAAVT